MQPHFVRIKLVKGNLSLYYVEPYNLYQKDFMIQANEMAKPYIKEGWHLVHAMMVDYHH